MENRNTFFIAILISVCIFCIALGIFLFRHVKKIEFDFNEKEAALITENMDLQDRIEKVQETIKEKTKEINTLKKEKEKLSGRVQSAEEENEKLSKAHAERVGKLEEERELLHREIKTLKEMPITGLIRKAIAVEEDENIKKVLERTLRNMELVKSGNFIGLEPIVVTEEGGIEGFEGPKAAMTALHHKKRTGKILSIDKRNNLIVISLGTGNEIEEGRRLIILKSGEEIASAEIINSRYKISAAFIDDIKYGYTINDIREGYKVLVSK